VAYHIEERDPGGCGAVPTGVPADALTEVNAAAVAKPRPSAAGWSPARCGPTGWGPTLSIAGNSVTQGGWRRRSGSGLAAAGRTAERILPR
jgi:hypothetical protein